MPPEVPYVCMYVLRNAVVTRGFPVSPAPSMQLPSRLAYLAHMCVCRQPMAHPWRSHYKYSTHTITATPAATATACGGSGAISQGAFLFATPGCTMRPFPALRGN